MNEHRAIIPACTEMERYLFDLNGYLILEERPQSRRRGRLNATYDEIEAAQVEGRGWYRPRRRSTIPAGRKG